MKKLILGCLLLFTLAACEPAGPTKSFDQHTGFETTASSKAVVYTRNALIASWTVTGQAATSVKNGQRLYAVNYHYTGDGWAFIDKAWMNGSQLNLEQGERRVGTCSQYGCTNHEQGIVVLSEKTFRQAAKTGMEFQLAGSRASFVVSYPAKLFQEVLSTM